MARRVSLDDSVIDTLIARRLQLDEEQDQWGAAYEDSGRVFAYENGRELRPDHVSSTFERVIASAGYTKIQFHDLRHLHASLLIAAGILLAIVSKRLGHSTSSISVDLRGHLLRDANRGAAEAAAGMFHPKT